MGMANFSSPTFTISAFIIASVIGRVSVNGRSLILFCINLYETAQRREFFFDNIHTDAPARNFAYGIFCTETGSKNEVNDFPLLDRIPGIEQPFFHGLFPHFFYVYAAAVICHFNYNMVASLESLQNDTPVFFFPFLLPLCLPAPDHGRQNSSQGA